MQHYNEESTEVFINQESGRGEGKPGRLMLEEAGIRMLYAPVLIPVIVYTHTHLFISVQHVSDHLVIQIAFLQLLLLWHRQNS